MKKILKIALLLLFVFVYSCEPDLLDDNLPNDRDARSAFIGSWICTEQSKLNGESVFTVRIIESVDNTSEVGLINFYLFGNEDTAKAVIADNHIRIPLQSFCNHQIQGDGYINASENSIDWSYQVDDGEVKDICTAVFAKK